MGNGSKKSNSKSAAADNRTVAFLGPKGVFLDHWRDEPGVRSCQAEMSIPGESASAVAIGLSSTKQVRRLFFTNGMVETVEKLVSFSPVCEENSADLLSAQVFATADQKGSLSVGMTGTTHDPYSNLGLKQARFDGPEDASCCQSRTSGSCAAYLSADFK
jgi:hypothetical protein